MMSTSIFRARFFVFLSLTKIIIIAWLFFMWLTHGFNFKQLKEVFYIIAPIFATHLIPAFSFYAKRTKPGVRDIVVEAPKVLVRASWILLSLYTIYMIAVIALVPGTEEAFDNMKEMLAWAEILFGVLIGIIVAELYSS